MSVHKALHPIDDTGRLYVSRKEGSRGLVRIDDGIGVSKQGLKENFRKSKD